jgi:hypothetical protein
VSKAGTLRKKRTERKNYSLLFVFLRSCFNNRNKIKFSNQKAFLKVGFSYSVYCWKRYQWKKVFSCFVRIIPINCTYSSCISNIHFWDRSGRLEFDSKQIRTRLFLWFRRIKHDKIFIILYCLQGCTVLLPWHSLYRAKFMVNVRCPPKKSQSPKFWTSYTGPHGGCVYNLNFCLCVSF